MKKSYAAQMEQRRRFWAKHLQRLEQSGLTQVDYCRQNNLNVHRVWYWKKKLAKQTQNISLVEVPAGSAGAITVSSFSNAPIRMRVDGRFMIEIEKGFDPATLQQLLQVIESL